LLDHGRSLVAAQLSDTPDPLAANTERIEGNARGVDPRAFSLRGAGVTCEGVERSSKHAGSRREACLRRFASCFGPQNKRDGRRAGLAGRKSVGRIGKAPRLPEDGVPKSGLVVLPKKDVFRSGANPPARLERLSPVPGL